MLIIKLVNVEWLIEYQGFSIGDKESSCTVSFILVLFYHTVGWIQSWLEFYEKMLSNT